MLTPLAFIGIFALPIKIILAAAVALMVLMAAGTVVDLVRRATCPEPAEPSPLDLYG